MWRFAADDLRLAQRVEDLPLEQFVAQPGIERLDVFVLPGRARGTVGRLDADRRDPGTPRPAPTVKPSLPLIARCWAPNAPTPPGYVPGWRRWPPGWEQRRR